MVIEYDAFGTYLFLNDADLSTYNTQDSTRRSELMVKMTSIEDVEERVQVEQHKVYQYGAFMELVIRKSKTKVVQETVEGGSLEKMHETQDSRFAQVCAVLHHKPPLEAATNDMLQLSAKHVKKKVEYEEKKLEIKNSPLQAEVIGLSEKAKDQQLSPEVRNKHKTMREIKYAELQIMQADVRMLEQQGIEIWRQFKEKEALVEELKNFSFKAFWIFCIENLALPCDFKMYSIGLLFDNCLCNCIFTN